MYIEAAEAELMYVRVLLNCVHILLYIEVYFHQHKHALACISIVKNVENYLKIIKNYLFRHAHI